jgi:hypothetical protein
MFVLLFTQIAFAATLSTRIGRGLIVYQENTILRSNDGFDQRFLNVTDPPLDVGRFRRLLEIQSTIQTLENPAVSIDVRAELAQKSMRDFFIDHPMSSSPNAQLWQRWLNDGLEWP